MRAIHFVTRLPLSVVAFLLLFLTSCEKEVNIDLGSEPSKMVVQGSIETGLPPIIILTSTMSFFSSVDLKSFEKSFLHGADIRVSDGTKTIKLAEYTFDTTNAKFYVYSIDTANFSLANIMLGETGKTYSLTITYDGKKYESVTKIPQVKGPDTLWFAPPQFKRSRTPENAKQLFANYTDPDTPGNYVRYYTSRNRGQFFPVGIFSDEVVNGKTVNNIALYAGGDYSGNENPDSLRYFYYGDSVTIKWSEIDKNVYTFWNTYQFSVNSTGNPFSSPINVKSNISNGALGVWAGYGVWQKTMAVPQ
jgi:hypothetical protein